MQSVKNLPGNQVVGVGGACALTQSSAERSVDGPATWNHKQSIRRVPGNHVCAGDCVPAYAAASLDRGCGNGHEQDERAAEGEVEGVPPLAVGELVPARAVGAQLDRGAVARRRRLGLRSGRGAGARRGLSSQAISSETLPGDRGVAEMACARTAAARFLRFFVLPTSFMGLDAVSTARAEERFSFSISLTISGSCDHRQPLRSAPAHSRAEWARGGSRSARSSAGRSRRRTRSCAAARAPRRR